MIKYFKGSFLFTFVCLIIALLWTHISHGSGELQALFIVVVLALLEISFSFDNAVVNAMKLEKMSPIWQHRFLTWGIIIAVFGMRFLFPVLVVSIFSGQSLIKVLQMALWEPDNYTYYLQISHPPIITFGATFLFMLCLNYFIYQEKEVYWIGIIEKPLQYLKKIPAFHVILTVAILYFVNQFVSPIQKSEVLMAGLWGILVYLLIEGMASLLERKEKKISSNVLANTCFVNFMYLELIDASFSLDGVLGAFALSKDIFIITLGLAIGAMFVRSMTIAFVEKKTLKQFVYLEHGAHWAIGALALIMFISSFKELSEVLTGLIGITFILSAFICSIKKNKN